MNVAIFVDSYLPIINGVVTSINQLKAGLEEEGNTVHIFTVDMPGAQPQDRVHRFPSIKFGKKTGSMIGLVSHRRVVRSLRELKIDLVHTHSEYSLGWAGKRAALELNLPLVHTNHTLWQHYTHYVPWFLLLFFKVEKTMGRFMRGFKFVIAPSVKAEAFYRPLSDPDATFRIIPNGVDHQGFVTAELTSDEIEAQRAAVGVGPDDRLAMFAGRIGPEKRVEQLITALIPLLKRRSNFKIILVGEGSSLPHLKKLTRENGLERQVIFTGFVNWTQMHRFYRASQVFVTASVSEVHPMTLIEAAIAGLPLVARDDDAYKPLLSDGVNGFLTASDAGIAEKLERLFDDEALRVSFSKASFVRSEAYTAEQHVKSVKAFYDFIRLSSRNYLHSL